MRIPRHADRDDSRAWPLRIVLGLVLALFAGGVVVAAYTWLSPNPAPSPTAAPTSAPTTPPATTPPTRPAPSPAWRPTGPDPEPITYEIAHLTGDVPKYDSPGGPQNGIVEGSWYGYPSILPVYERADGFVRVGVQIRPNESSAWIAEDSVAEFTESPYRIVINVATTKLTLFENEREVFTAPVGVGLPAYPTPLGKFFLTAYSEPPNASYGPYVIALSAHSETITDWQGSGDAITAIHGPVGSDEEIGTEGAVNSHGCVRMHLEDLAKLAEIPVGSPVDVIDGVTLPLNRQGQPVEPYLPDGVRPA